MKTITVTLHSDEDAAYLMDKIQNATKFKGEVEIFEMDEAISDEHLEAFDERMEEFYGEEFGEPDYIAFQRELQERFGIKFILKQPNT